MTTKIKNGFFLHFIQMWVSTQKSTHRKSFARFKLKLVTACTISFFSARLFTSISHSLLLKFQIFENYLETLGGEGKFVCMNAGADLVSSRGG